MSSTFIEKNWTTLINLSSTTLWFIEGCTLIDDPLNLFLSSRKSPTFTCSLTYLVFTIVSLNFIIYRSLSFICWPELCQFYIFVFYTPYIPWYILIIYTPIELCIRLWFSPFKGIPFSSIFILFRFVFLLVFLLFIVAMSLSRPSCISPAFLMWYFHLISFLLLRVPVALHAIFRWLVSAVAVRYSMSFDYPWSFHCWSLAHFFTLVAVYLSPFSTPRACYCTSPVRVPFSWFWGLQMCVLLLAQTIVAWDGWVYFPFPRILLARKRYQISKSMCFRTSLARLLGRWFLASVMLYRKDRRRNSIQGESALHAWCSFILKKPIGFCLKLLE